MTGETEDSMRHGIEILWILEVKPCYSQEYLWLGELYAETGDREKALEKLRIAEVNFRETGIERRLAKTEGARRTLEA